MSTLTAKGIPVPENLVDDFDPEGDLGAIAQWLDDHPGISSHTTAERDLLVGADVWPGRVIFNTTLERLEVNKTGAAGAAAWSDRLQALAQSTADWNTATVSGRYYSIDTAANAPSTAGAYWVGDVSAVDANFIVQTVSYLADDNTPDAADYRQTFRRAKQAGVWGAWARLDQIAGTDIVSGTVAIARLPVAASGSTSSTQVVRADDVRLTPAGSISMYAGSAAPNGYLLCDGTAVSRITYSGLFAVVGTTYGPGDGATSFNLPNLKGRVPVGRDATQAEFDTLGEAGGAKTHTLAPSEIPSHAHTIDHDHGAATTSTDGNHTHDLARSPNEGDEGSRIEAAGLGNVAGHNTGAAGAHSHTFDVPYYAGSSGSAGGGGAHNNLQPYLTLNYIIKH